MTEAIILNPTSAIMYATRGMTSFDCLLFMYTLVFLFLLPRMNVYPCIFFKSLTASVYIKMKKPNAAIRDANAALEVILFPSIPYHDKMNYILARPR